MAGKTKPKCRRHVVQVQNPVALALNTATCLTPKEVKDVMASVHRAVEAMRTGTATVDNWLNLVTAVSVGISIEDQGVVKGLRTQLQEADVLLAKIEARATASGPWRSPTLYAHELVAIKELATLHEFQIKQLSAGEFQKAVRLAIARFKDRGAKAKAGATGRQAVPSV